ncbi:uncharacterized protein B0H18DRAFT_109611 [Fomitopsis serialis]|uniref:uncharacterized protein n=1 Tax=Fomitopsis serialis TaxID=139415 RepID=UPI002008552B|nr:uncharacterized protein B0H18DRAFT_109611 [Neoantrodia serialis]KAH9915080.1 hypothetical protein B0H18DRAFT_109611 [Neoantrodia serialis]
MATLFVCAGLAVWRLWDVHRQTPALLTSGQGSSRISFTVVNAILVESALMYTLTVIAVTVTDFLEFNVYYFAIDASVQVAGICFDLVLARIWNGVAGEQIQSSAHTRQSELQYWHSTSLSTRMENLGLEPVAGTSRERMLPWSCNGGDSFGRVGVAKARARRVSMPELMTSPRGS